MSRLFNLMLHNFSKMILFPLYIGIVIVLSLLLYVIFREKKWIKYIPSITSIVVGIIIAIPALINFTDESGLKLAWIAIVVCASGFIGLFFSWIIALIESIIKNYKEIKD
ncbi:MAG: hypothetical protein SOZ89_05170 [Peptoniphilaceae bacterium]|nr:hypothetical protein [Peptoniphilaceae bacterium]MDD7383440.1 hypothetical protein [Peptoniphilaceae bacterium]MDY3738496.1 hypothetical protein [Peptoniphilaceae bacterium]